MMMLNRYLKIAFILLVLPAVAYAGRFKVIYVSDGDTLKAESQGFEVTVRLVGIDAPETSKKKNQPGQPFSKKAKINLQRLVLDKTVEIDGFGLDRYSRMLGVVYVDNKNVNLEMVKEGLAEVYRGKVAKGLDIDPYWKAEAEAKKEMLNIWSLGDKYVSPRDWRKLNK
jgi:endonuclease YncB( thermonuclease family)